MRCSSGPGCFLLVAAREGALDGQQEFVKIQRLGKEARGAGASNDLCSVFAAEEVVGAHDDHAAGRVALQHLTQQADSVEPRHLAVRQHDVGSELRQHAQGDKTIFGGSARVGLITKQLCERCSREGLVVNH